MNRLSKIPHRRSSSVTSSSSNNTGVRSNIGPRRGSRQDLDDVGNSARRRESRAKSCGRLARTPQINNTLTTPSIRIGTRSPLRRKQIYANLIEGDHINRIIRFVFERTNGEVNSIKPVTNTSFIMITQLFLCELGNFPKLTTMNFKTELPNYMKILKYPIPISQSFLKTPNTPQNFQHVLSIWTFLMDLIDVTSSDDIELGQNELIFVYHQKSVEDEPLARTELMNAIYADKGITSNELSSLIKSHQQTSAIFHKRKLIEEKEKLVCDEIHELKEKCAYKQQLLFNVNKDREQEEIKLNLIRTNIQEIGQTPADVYRLDREIERLNHLKGLLSSRFNIQQEECRKAQDEQAEIDMKALELSFAFNDKIKKCSLPESFKMDLKLSEGEVCISQVQNVSTTVSNLLTQALVSRDDYRKNVNVATNNLIAAESTLAEATIEADDAKRSRLERNVHYNQLKADKIEISALIDEEVSRITNWKEKCKTEKSECEKLYEVVKDHKESTDDCINTIRTYTNKIRETVSTSTQRIREKDKQLVDSTISMNNELLVMIQKQFENLPIDSKDS